MYKFDILVASIVGIITAIFWYFVIKGLRTHPIDDLNFLGSIILILGFIFIIFYRSIGKKTYDQAVSFKPFSTDSSWVKFGEHNTQKLYLIISVITAVSGFIILLFNTFNQ